MPRRREYPLMPEAAATTRPDRTGPSHLSITDSYPALQRQAAKGLAGGLFRVPGDPENRITLLTCIIIE